MLTHITKLAWICGAVALAAVSAGCDRAPEPTAEATPPRSTTPVAVDVTRQADTAAVDDVVASTDSGLAAADTVSGGGGILQIETPFCGIPDPAVDFANLLGDFNFAVATEIHAGLTRMGESSLDILPELASSFTSSQGNTQFEFLLRPGLKFSDGEPLLASDVKWSWERALRKSTPPSRARTVLGGIIGADELLAGKSDDLTGVEVVDDRQLIVTLSGPQPDFPARVSDPVAFVLQPYNALAWDDVWTNDDTLPSNAIMISEIPLIELPVGAGPFKLIEYPDHRMTGSATGGLKRCVLARNPHYHNPDLPKLEGVVGSIHPDIWQNPAETATRQSAAMTLGELDIARARSVLGGNAAMPTDTPFALFTSDGGVSITGLVIDPSRTPFDELDVRRAFAQSVPDIFTGSVPSVRATRIFPESFAAHTSPATTSTNGDALSRNPQPLTESARGLTIDYHVWSKEFVGDDDEAIWSMWKEFLDAEINLRVHGIETNTRRTNPRIVRLNINNIAPFPHDVINAVIGVFGEESMPAQFEQVKLRLKAAKLEPDAAKRIALYNEIEQHLLDQALVIPLDNQGWQTELLVQPWVKGMRYPQFGDSYFRDIWLDETAPNRQLPPP